MKTISSNTHKGPPPGILAAIFALLFLTGLSFVISLSGTPPYYPGPWETTQTIGSYFKTQSGDVLMCAFFQLGAAIPLGLFTASIVSRLRFLGVKAAGTHIALFGGFVTAINLMLSASILWVMSHTEIAMNESITHTLYYLTFAIGGVGYSVPLGLLIAGVSVTSGMLNLLPKWLVWPGIAISLIAESSFFSLIFPNLLFLIPLTRFPGFIWLIMAGFRLPKTTERKA